MKSGKLFVHTVVLKFSCAKISAGKTSNTTITIYAYSCSYTEASGLLKALPFTSSRKMFFLLGPFPDSFLGVSLSSPGQRAYHLKIMLRTQYTCLHEEEVARTDNISCS